MFRQFCVPRPPWFGGIPIRLVFPKVKFDKPNCALASVFFCDHKKSQKNHVFEDFDPLISTFFFDEEFKNDLIFMILWVKTVPKVEKT